MKGKHPVGTVRNLDPSNPKHLATLVSLYGRHAGAVASILGHHARAARIQKLMNPDDTKKASGE